MQLHSLFPSQMPRMTRQGEKGLGKGVRSQAHNTAWEGQGGEQEAGGSRKGRGEQLQKRQESPVVRVE